MRVELCQFGRHGIVFFPSQSAPCCAQEINQLLEQRFNEVVAVGQVYYGLCEFHHIASEQVPSPLLHTRKHMTTTDTAGDLVW